jgi:hypothetical protein
MADKKNQYSNVVRPNVKFTPEEDLAVDDFVNFLQQKMKRKVMKGELIKKCVFYCKKMKINPFDE